MVITELWVKEYLKTNKEQIFNLEKNMILTPSARDLLSKNGVEIIRENSKINNSTINSSTRTNLTRNNPINSIDKINNTDKIDSKNKIESPTPSNYSGIEGEIYFTKDEDMTHLWDNVIVKKNNPRVILRGKIDNILGESLVIGKEFKKAKSQKLDEDFISLIWYIRKIMESEIKNTNLLTNECLGHSLDKIKEMTHNPKKYFNREHLFEIDLSYDIYVLQLNRIRTLVREVELVAMDGYYSELGLAKKDLILSLNRLSSIVYIMMLKGVTGEYRYESSNRES